MSLLAKIHRCCLQFCFIFAMIVAPLAYPKLTAAQPLKEVRITTSLFGPATFLPYYAHDKRFFEQEGLDVKMILSKAEASIAAMVAGDAQYTTMAVTAVEAAVRGFPLRTIALTPQYPTWSFVARKGIKTMSDLKGKSIATTSPGGLLHSVTIDLLRHFRLDPKDVDLRAIGAPPVRVASLESGAVDATILDTPLDIELAQKGFNIILEVGPIVKLPTGGMSTTLERIQNSREEVSKVFRAILRATRAFTDPQNKEEAIQYLVEKFKVKKSVAAEAYPRIAASLSPTGMVDRGVIQAIIDRAVKQTPKYKPLDPEFVVDFSFERGLGPQLIK